MSRIVDKRQNGRNQSAVNRQRFIHRFKNQIKKSVTDAITKRSIKDIHQGEQIHIPAKDIRESSFKHGEGGSREAVFTGNKEFVPGDRIERPPKETAEASGSKASNTGEGSDDFSFEISKDEFLELFFEDLALPDLIKTKIGQMNTVKWIRAGTTIDGVPTNINIKKSLIGAMGRRIALRSPHKRALKELEKKRAQWAKKFSANEERIIMLDKEIEVLKRKIKSIPFIDDIDLLYNRRVRETRPTTQAVMFCLMDVSGSMDEVKKDIAKRFFILLYLFLNRNYDKIEVVFIRHHTSAKEVNEEDFFYSRETGGTVVSSALELMHEIIQDRYPPSEWNIYGAQASDGDNWNADSPYCQEILNKKIMSYVQYYAYVEILPRHHQSLWEAYTSIAEEKGNFSMQTINDISEIYPVFRELFKRQAA